MLRPVCLGAFLFLIFGIPVNAATGKPPPARQVKDVTLSLTLRKDGTSTRTVHYEIQATNEAAAMRTGQISIRYDTALQTLKVVEAHTLKKDGTTIPVQPSAIYDQAAPGTSSMPIFTEFHIVTIVFPQFVVGDTAVYTVETTTKDAMLPGQFWYDDFFSPQTAFDNVHETITAPADMDLHIENYDVDFSKTRHGDKIVYSWHYAAPNPAPPETTLVSRFSRTPHFIATTFASYKALARSYAEVEEPKIAVTPAIQKLADKITNGVSSRREQAKKLYEWVSSHIRYVAVELGRGSLVPHAAPTVLANGYGDCKDHVVLLAALLKAKDIKSEGVLINAGNIYELTKVPTFVGLNHIITYLPEFDVYLDSTAIVAPFGVLPFNEYGKPVIYTSSADLRRGAAPILPQGQADLRTVTTAQLAKDGTLTGTTTTTGTGPYGVSLRYVGLAAQNLGPDNAAAKILAARGYGGDATGTLIAPSPMALTPSYTVMGRFTAKNWKEEVAGTRRFVLPGGLRVTSETGNAVMGLLGNRSLKDDAEFPCYSTHASEDISLTAPDGMQFDHVPDDTHVKTAYLRFDAHWTLDGSTMHVHRDFTSQIDQPLCTPEIRKANKAALKAISDGYDSQMLLDPANGQSTTEPSGAVNGDTTAQSNTHAKFQQMYADAKNAALREQNPAKSIRLLSAILTLPGLARSDAYAVHLARGSLYLSTDQAALAVADLNAVLAQTPDSQSALFARVQAYQMLEKPRKALKDLGRIIESAPHAQSARFMRATIEMQRHDYGRVRSDLSVLLHDNPNNAAARQMRGIADVRQGRYDEAATDFLHAERTDGPAPTDLDEVCVALSHSRKPDRAIAPCKRIVASAPYSGPARNGLGIAYFRLEKYREAMRQFRSASQTYPNNAEYLYAMGVAETKLGDSGDGRRNMARAEKMSPGIGRKLRRFGISP